MVIKNLENKIKLVLIICSLFLVGCVVICISSIWTARNMVTDAQKKVYVLDGNVPILVQRSTMEETLDVEAKSHIEMFHHFFFTLAPDDKYIKYTMEKAMYLVDETGLAQYNTLKEKGFLFLAICLTINIYCLTKRLHVTKMKQKYHKKYKTQQMLFSVASYYFTIMWQSVQIVMMMKCHISNIFASLRRCKDKHFSRHTIKTPQLSVHIYNIGLGATQPRGPNCTLQERL